MKIKHKQRQRKGFSLIELLVVITIIAGLAAMSYGPIMSKVREGKRTQAIGQARNLQVALFSFAQKNDGLYPSEDTAEQGHSGSSAEECFNQLISSDINLTEKLFWNLENAVLGNAKGVAPDEDGELTPGENVWGYAAGLNTSSRTDLPLFFDACVSPGKFSTEVWDAQAILCKLDASVAAQKITFKGKGYLNDDGSFKIGTLTKKRGNKEYDILSSAALPSNVEVFSPGGGGSVSRIEE